MSAPTKLGRGPTPDPCRGRFRSLRTVDYRVLLVIGGFGAQNPWIGNMRPEHSDSTSPGTGHRTLPNHLTDIRCVQAIALGPHVTWLAEIGCQGTVIWPQLGQVDSSGGRQQGEGGAGRNQEDMQES